MKLVLVAPRTLSQPAGWTGSLVPWVEVTLVFPLHLPEWGVSERVFLHWAAQWPPQGAATWRPFDPGRRAARPQLPAGVDVPQLDESLAWSWLQQLLPLVPRTLYRHQQLGLVSSLGENLARFRHRCLKAFAPLVQEGLWRRDVQAARAVAQMLEGIEEYQFSRLEPEEARVGLGFYPEGVEPTTSSEELMIERGGAFRP